MSQQAIAALEQMGFSAYEARVYLGLLQQSPTTGYQLSRLSGVPHSRIYETLERLTAKGYAVALQTEPAEYSPWLSANSWRTCRNTSMGAWPHWKPSL